MVRTYLANEFGVVKSCRALKLATSSYYYVAKPRKDDSQILAAIEEYLEREGPIGYIAMSKILKPRFGDVTQFSIRGRNAFLALLTDLYNREIVGYAVSWSNDTNLVMQCLKRAQNKRGSLVGALHHTDADVRYIVFTTRRSRIHRYAG